ncbi:MAG: GldG family protein, partial [Myxococcales bacterium]|nr:GldG family protein [Myxococcales bacterium]
FERFDATKNELFSLSSGSKRLAGSLSDKLEITAYFTADLPPPFNATERYVRDILAEYQAASKGKIKVSFINPDTDAEKEQAQKDGVSAVKHQVIENDGVSVKEGFRGLVMRYLDREEIVPVIENTEGLEYLLTSRIKQLQGDKVPIAILTGHGEASSASGLAGLGRCMPTYEFRDVTADADIAPDTKALLIVGATEAIPEDQLRRINKYVMEGHSLAVFGGGMKIDLEQGAAAVPIDTGLNALLKPWGVTLKPGIAADANCSRGPLRTQFGVVGVPHPPVPIVLFDEAKSENPVLFRLSSATLPFMEPLGLGTAPGGAKLTALAETSENSWLMTGERIDLQPKDPREIDTSGPTGPFTLLATVSGTLPSAFPNNASVAAEAPATIEAPDSSKTPVRVLVAGGALFVRDEAMPQPQGQEQCPMTNNVALALNAVDWLTQDSDLIAVRAKNVEDPAIDVPSDVQAAEDAARTAQDSVVAAAQVGDAANAEKASKERDDA